jgi:hypothetical protein
MRALETFHWAVGVPHAASESSKSLPVCITRATSSFDVPGSELEARASEDTASGYNEGARLLMDNRIESAGWAGNSLDYNKLREK